MYNVIDSINFITMKYRILTIHLSFHTHTHIIKPFKHFKHVYIYIILLITILAF